jgi:hypothetical protein
VRRVLLFATCVALAAPAFASDGRIELSQTCALAGTCTSGDSPGFPISVSAGSYVLTSNLTIPDPATTAILGNDDVTIDLNGFAITGVTNCTGAPAVCTNTGGGFGINLAARATIRNGTIRRMGYKGIATGGAALIENMTIAENGHDGIASSDRGQQILRCRILQNGGDGLTMYYGNSQGSLVQGNTFYGNGESGVQMVGGNVLDNTATYNGDEGFYMATYAGFHHNKAAENNGGNANDQVSGGVGTDNVCGTVACN